MASIKGYSLNRLSVTQVIRPFHCNNNDLTDFLLNDAKYYEQKLLAVTYVLENADLSAAFFSVANDKIAVEDVDYFNQWRRFRNKLSSKHHYHRSFPALKIGRFAVHSALQHQGIGSEMLDFIKGLFVINNRAGCTFLTVDAYTASVPFYERNGFRLLCPNREEQQSSVTRLMYFDLRTLV